MIGHMTEANAQLDDQRPVAAGGRTGSSAGRGEATRRRLLVAAAQLIAERGWGEVTTRDVAERAGVNAALVHYHFGSMDSLLREAAMARLEPELAAAMAPLTEDRRLEDALTEAVTGLDRFDLASQPGILAAEVLLRATRDQALAGTMGNAIRAFREALADRLRADAAQGEIRGDVSPEVMAVIIGATLDGLLLQRMADPEVDPAEVAAGLYRLLEREER